MLVKEIYIVCFLCLVNYQCTAQTARSSRHRIEKRRPIDFKNNTLIISNFKSARHNLIKEREKKDKTRKWPKILRQNKDNDESFRITKMDMLQETEATEYTAPPPPDNAELEDDNLSSYNLKEQMQKLAKGLPHLNITPEVIGRTLEYKDILMLRISQSQGSDKFFRADDHKYAEEVPEKKIIFIVHGLSIMGIRDLPCLSELHAFRKLLSYYTSYLDRFDIFLIPIANPDGYSYLGTEQILFTMLWNKNVSPQSECPGVALDRNFEVAWTTNRSISSCSQEYPGSAPFSEAETRAVRDIFHKYAHKIIAYFHVHAVSYDSSIFRGDAVLYPKGYNDNTADDDKYIDLRSEIDEAIRNASFQVLSVAVDTLYNWYGKVTGTSVDYASTIYGIPFAMELVMQYYQDDDDYSDSGHYADTALCEVWKRVIGVIFGFIWKSLHGSDAR